MYASVCVLYILFCLLDLQTLDPLTLACACVCAGGGLRTESILYEGYWKDASDDVSKNTLVDEGWTILDERGVCRELWAEFNKWRGEAGRQANIVVPEPPRALCTTWTAGHVPQMDPRAKGKGKSKHKHR